MYAFEIMSTGPASCEVSLPSCDPFLQREIQNMESFPESGVSVCVLPKIKQGGQKEITACVHAPGTAFNVHPLLSLLLERSVCFLQLKLKAT